MLAHKQYELTNHLGNVLATVQDRKTPVGTSTISRYTADVTNATYYYPFGSAMKTWGGDTTYKFKYGFNGKERDNEMYGDGNSYDFGARIYDSRLGKWLTLDPLMYKFGGWSGYNYSFNSPISMFDPDGKEPRLGQLATVEQIQSEAIKVLKAVRASNNPNIQTQLFALQAHFEGNRLFERDENTGILRDAPGSKNVKRYVYTEKGGWIDMHHFTRMAMYAYNNGAKKARLIAYQSEKQQDNASGYSYEDLPSNEFGIQFMEQYREQIESGKIKIEDAMAEFLKNLGAVDPKKAPNYKYIPHTVTGQDTPKNYTAKPFVGNFLKAYHYVKHRLRSRERQEQIKNAHEQIKN